MFPSEIDNIQISADPPVANKPAAQVQKTVSPSTIASKPTSTQKAVELQPKDKAPTVIDDKAPTVDDESDFVVWMKRALTAEQQLVEMAKLYEDEHRRLAEAIQAADESGKWLF